MGANFSGKVAKALVNYITYSCADAIAKMKPDAAIFECEAGLSERRIREFIVLERLWLLFIYFIYFLIFFFQR